MKEALEALRRKVQTSVFRSRGFVHFKMTMCVFSGCGGGATLLLTQLVLVLLPETVSGGEEVPAPLLVHLPHVRLLQGRRRNTS